jgi:hypothetical protein
MSEQSTTPDLVELSRRQLEAVNRRDMDAVMSRCPADGLYDTSPDTGYTDIDEGRAAAEHLTAERG